jgi:hypothetical protein
VSASKLRSQPTGNEKDHYGQPRCPHVALDLLKLPEEVYRGKRYDTVAICVDRLSSWLIATPHLAKGCSGREVALAMLDKWDIFSIPAVVSSDRGSHFVAIWWQTLCGALGVRVAFAQAYHHQASRAEVAYRVLQTLLRKMVDREQSSWVEALPAALRILNDLPGPTGYSADQLAFGRDHPMAGFPRQPPRIAEDALDFLERMEDLRKSRDSWKLCTSGMRTSWRSGGRAEWSSRPGTVCGTTGQHRLAAESCRATGSGRVQCCGERASRAT